MGIFEPRDSSQTSADFMQIDLATTKMEEQMYILLLLLLKKMEKRVKMIESICLFAARCL